MSKSVKINNVTYENVPQVSIPLSAGTGTADFYDTSDATATAANVLTGKNAYIGSGKVSGTMTNNGAVAGSISTVKGTYTIPTGYHSGAGTVSIASTEQAKIIADNIKSGVTILGVSGSSTVVDTSDATAAAGTIVSGKTAYVKGTKITGSLTTISVSQDSTSKVLTIE